MHLVLARLMLDAAVAQALRETLATPAVRRVFFPASLRQPADTIKAGAPEFFRGVRGGGAIPASLQHIRTSVRICSLGIDS